METWLPDEPHVDDDLRKQMHPRDRLAVEALKRQARARVLRSEKRKEKRERRKHGTT